MISVFDYLLTHSKTRRERLFAVLQEFPWTTPPAPEMPEPAPMPVRLVESDDERKLADQLQSSWTKQRLG